MPDAAQKRALAEKCRELAKNADSRTAANLRMLADEYEAEARAPENEAEPRPVDKPKQT